jgi:hypothetical protein
MLTKAQIKRGESVEMRFPAAVGGYRTDRKLKNGVREGLGIKIINTSEAIIINS